MSGAGLTGESTLLLIGGREESLAIAREFGQRVVLVQTPEEYRPSCAPYLSAALLVDYTDWERLRPLVEALHRAQPIGAVVSLVEPGLLPAARVAELLGLPGNPPEVSLRLRDKGRMRAHLAASGFPTPAATEVGDAAELADFATRHGYPFVVKPVDAAAGVGVLLVDGPGEVDRTAAEMDRLRRGSGGRLDRFFPIRRFLAEEYLVGPEFSVEAFSFRGRHVVLAVTEKLVSPSFVELGHALPAALPPRAEQELVRHVEEFLTVTGVIDGPSHTELRLTAAGPRVIESHDRPGGGRILDLVEAAYGVDLRRLAVGWAVGAVAGLPGRPEARQAAATRFLTVDTEDGVLVGVTGTDRAMTVPGAVACQVTAVPGARVRRPVNNWDRLGQVIATGATVTEARSRCEQMLTEVYMTVQETPEAAGVGA